MENMTTWTAAVSSYPISSKIKTAPSFGMSSATGLSAVPFQGIAVTGLGVVAGVDPRPDNAKLGRPPRGNHC